jgi:formiminotetrahydrofolate cyclodeaminase
MTASALETVPIGRFLDDLASAAPAPGGGAAAGLAGALAAALVAMVCRVTARREPPGAELLEAARRADELRGRMARLTADDATAYGAVLAARRAHDPAAEAALARATEVPLAVARAAADVLALAGEVAPAARASTLGDLGVALALAAAALDGATITARANVAEMADPARARAAGAEIDGLVADGQARRGRAAEAIARRAGAPAP